MAGDGIEVAEPGPGTVGTSAEVGRSGTGTRIGSGTAQGTFKLLLFASASTFTGVESLTLPAPTTLRELLTTTLESQFPGFMEKVLESAAVTVNLEYVDFDIQGLHQKHQQHQHRVDNRQEQGSGLDLVIHQGDEVGILPPVSSG